MDMTVTSKYSSSIMQLEIALRHRTRDLGENEESTSKCVDRIVELRNERLHLTAEIEDIEIGIKTLTLAQLNKEAQSNVHLGHVHAMDGNTATITPRPINDFNNRPLASDTCGEKS